MVSEINTKQILEEYRTAYPELRTLTDEEILSVLNDSANGINLKEDERISMFGLNEQGLSGLELEKQEQKAEIKDNTDKQSSDGIKAGAIVGGAAILLAAILSRGKIKNGINKVYNKILPQHNINGLSYRIAPFGKKYKLKLNEEDKRIVEFILKQKRTPNPHPTNLTKELQRVYYTPEMTKEVLRNSTNLSPIVGSLPQKWGKRLAGKEGLEQVDRIFYELSSAQYSGSLKPEHLKLAQTNLSKLLKTEVVLEPLGAGNIGAAYKLTADGQTFVLKCFRPITRDWWKYIHGNYPELNAAVYASKHDPNHFAKFYMGRFGEKEDGYILTKFLEGSNPEGKTIYDFTFKKHSTIMTSGDIKSDNVIGNKLIDYGAAKPNQIIDGFTTQEKKLLNLLSDALDSNNITQVEKLVSQYGKSPEFPNVKKYIQLLTEQYAAKPKYGIAAGYTIEYFMERSEVLKKLGINSIPNYGALYRDKIYFWGPDFAEKYYGLTFKEYRKLDSG